MHSNSGRPFSRRRTVVGIARISLLLLVAAFAGVSKAPAQIVGVSITVAPPALPVYDQPPIPGPGYIWTPGYWAWDDGDYYWVPGTWCEPPAVGLLWTPGYWGWHDGIYAWNAGYWGPHIGFYGGVSYGFGYTGVGYAGGFWRGGVFSYNRSVNNFGSVNITNVYNKTVINNNVTNNVSFNGGAGGLTAKANQQELAAANERHTPPTNVQTQHQQQASTNRELRHSVNNGHPTVAATSHAGHFEGAGVMAAHHDGGAGHTGGEHSPAGGGHSPMGGGPKGPAALNAHGPGGANPPKVNNASLNAGQGAHQGGAIGHTGGGMHTGGPPGGFRPGGGNPPRVANVARPPARGPAPRGPAPKGPPPHGPQHH
jgi:hypothetical protein